MRRPRLAPKLRLPAPRWDVLARRLLVLATGVLAALPVISSTVKAEQAGWVPAGDDGIIATRGWDVLTSHTPLVGQYSEAGLVIHGQVMHSPGPMLYWLLALPARYSTVGSLAITMCVLNTLAIIALRGAGPPPRRPGADVRGRVRDLADVPVAPRGGDARHLEPGGGAVPVPGADLHRVVAGVRGIPPAAAGRPGGLVRAPDPPHVPGPDAGGGGGRPRGAGGVGDLASPGRPAGRARRRGRGGRSRQVPRRLAGPGSGRGRWRRW